MRYESKRTLDPLNNPGQFSSPLVPQPGRAGRTNSRNAAVAKRKPSTRPLAFVLLGLLVAAMWIIEVIDTVMGGRLESEGVRPRNVDGLSGIVFAPLLHDDWAHLIGNTISLLVVGSIIALSGAGALMWVTAIGWVLSGVLSWLVGGPGTVHIGASGIVFAYIVFVIVRGVFSRSILHLAVGFLAASFYGLGLLGGIMPWGNTGISWQSHLGGLLGGILAAATAPGRRQVRGKQQSA